ncbi:trimethylamine methyltransferase family protein [Curvivirga sp.]|uniref:trimethylamine methyltransferase family protein n=1 Tax=Curvivirga sp. TaxID=2856848 RepID=UPI003B5A0837
MNDCQETNIDFPLFSNEKLDYIEGLTAQILEEVGMELRDDQQSLTALKEMGASVQGERVRISFDILKSYINKAPTFFTWRGVSDDKSLTIGKVDGQNTPIFAPMFGAPNVRRWDGYTQFGTYDDYVDLVKLCEEFPKIGTSGYLLCIVHDRTDKTKHLDMAEAHLKHSTKPMMGCVINEMALKAVAEEADATTFVAGETTLLHMINTTPPLVAQSNPLKCLREASVLGQASMVSSYMMMGCTSMVTVQETLAQGLAEVMMGVALSQYYQPGVAVMGGIYGVPFSMQSMLPNFGCAETQFVQMGGAQLMDRLGIPGRGDGMLTCSKIHDAQSGYDGIQLMQSSLWSKADLILHSAGWLEKGRVIDMNKFVQDAEMLENLDQVFF